MARAEQRKALRPVPERDGLVRAAIDPYVNALHAAFRGRARTVRASIREARRAVLDRLLAEGPGALGPREQDALLVDPVITDELHRRGWAEPDPARVARWGRPGAR
jgi:membrane glycosyltransferase